MALLKSRIPRMPMPFLLVHEAIKYDEAAKQTILLHCHMIYWIKWSNSFLQTLGSFNQTCFHAVPVSSWKQLFTFCWYTRVVFKDDWNYIHDSTGAWLNTRCRKSRTCWDESVRHHSSSCAIASCNFQLHSEITLRILSRPIELISLWMKMLHCL